MKCIKIKSINKLKKSKGEQYEYTGKLDVLLAVTKPKMFIFFQTGEIKQFQQKLNNLKTVYIPVKKPKGIELNENSVPFSFDCNNNLIGI